MHCNITLEEEQPTKVIEYYIGETKIVNLNDFEFEPSYCAYQFSYKNYFSYVFLGDNEKVKFVTKVGSV